MSLPPVAVLAGGLATRLHPHTARIPKSLVTVAGEPFLAHQLRLLRRQGFQQVVLCVGHLGEQIEAFTRAQAFGLNIAISYDGPNLRGTGGALRHALPLLGGNFAVLYGDSYLDEAVAPPHESFDRSGKPALMTVVPAGGGSGNVEYDGSAVRRHDKMAAGLDWLDYGLSFFRRAAIGDWRGDDDPFELATLTDALARAGDLAGFAMRRRFHEIGSIEGLRATELYIRSSRT